MSRPWPIHGLWYNLMFEVEHIGPAYDDVPECRVFQRDHDLSELLVDHTLREMCEPDKPGASLPIASGLYRATVRFWFFDGTDREGVYDCEYGLDVLALTRIGQKYYSLECSTRKCDTEIPVAPDFRSCLKALGHRYVCPVCKIEQRLIIDEDADCNYWFELETVDE